MPRSRVTIDANEAAAYVAHRTNEVIAIYPITPASPMGEWADQWSSQGETNIWGTVPSIVEMQSEGGAAGAVHGSLQAGSLTTTFTASQGLLLMIPNMYKIAGELTSTVFHIAARSVAAQALSIFGDHSDVMAARATGWGMLFSASPQEVMDLALIAQAATLESRIPFLHVFDGFRTSHEIQKIEKLGEEDIRALIDSTAVASFRARSLTPERPVIRGTAQNPDVFFQARESVNPYYRAAPEIVQGVMDRFAQQVGREYRLFEFTGAPDAERILVLMGSGTEAAEETVGHLVERGEKVGVVKVRLFRPFSAEHLLRALPATTRSIAVLDRTKEPGSAGEPLYQDVLTAVNEGMGEGFAPFGTQPRVVGGRYGLSSKEFTPAMVKGVLDGLEGPAPRNHFTVGIIDDVTHTSIDYDPSFDVESPHVTRAVFWGLGSDGTVGANKNTIKIIGESTDLYAQGYFVYDSKKAGARTISHLRFGPRPIRSPYLIQKAGFIGVHQFGFLERYDTLGVADHGATVLLNSPFAAGEVWDHIPRSVQEQIVEKELKLYVIDAYAVARNARLGGRINTIMQTGFFALSGVLPREEAVEKIKEAIRKTYGKRGSVVVTMNEAAVDAALDHLHEVDVPAAATGSIPLPLVVPEAAPEFVRTVTAPMIAGRGDELPVSLLPDDGTYPVGTTRWEKRNLALEVPVWEPDICIQCGKCVVVCPHSVIRAKVCPEEAFQEAPGTFKRADARWRNLPEEKYTLQVAVEDCTGCTLCVEVCPAKDKSQVGRKALNMAPQAPLRVQGRAEWEYFLDLPHAKRGSDNGENGVGALAFTTAKDVQLLDPLFEFSGACAGCGETAYLSLLTRLFGERLLVANATGCSSIYGGNLPTTPWTCNDEGRGPAWSNSLFEDNAEFGLGMRLALDKQRVFAEELLRRLPDGEARALAKGILAADQSTEGAIRAQRRRVEQLKSLLDGGEDLEARDLLGVADALVDKSLWIVGGDGWAYDIGYGGLDHVLASGKNVNVLVLDTEVYSNTGGQASKATGLGAVAKFAAGGKPTPKKDLGMLVMGYGYVYVAQVAMGANDTQTIKAFLEAEAYDGPSLIIAYSPCIAHGIDMAKGLDQQDRAVKSGYWPLYRYDPRAPADRSPLHLDSKAPAMPLADYLYNENRYRMLKQSRPEAAAAFLQESERLVQDRWTRYERLAQAPEPHEGEAP
ncbi:MAG: pyruvate:ferredoxin (flavodoxin) oxidoreductase [Gemmatimonadota bacterium]|nr:pyruvate:ferredoxin (flavodoxin) oxidoreductase [Gemmatimonadota bacterium]